jgi:hypothetical protein
MKKTKDKAEERVCRRKGEGIRSFTFSDSGHRKNEEEEGEKEGVSRSEEESWSSGVE